MSFINATEGSSRDFETLYQSLYLYGDEGSINLSVPIDHIYRKPGEANTDEIHEIYSDIGDNIILPCRPTSPSGITVDLFKQDSRPKEIIVDTISDIDSKIFSSHFYQHFVTPVFYYDARIGFVLNDLHLGDEGMYHCRFTSSYKYAEIKSFEVIFTKNLPNTSTNTPNTNFNVSNNIEINRSGIELLNHRKHFFLIISILLCSIITKTILNIA